MRRHRFDRPADDDAVAPAGRRTDWRTEVIGASGLNALAGIWLILSPWVLDYEDGDAAWNPVVVGAIVLAIGLVRAGGAHRAAWLSWGSAAAGVWLFASAFWLADSGQAAWNGVVMGTIVFALAVWSALASVERRAALR